MKAVNEKDIEITKELFEFIEKSPTAFHAVEQMKNRLDKEGYQQLLEGEKWELQSKEKILCNSKWLSNHCISHTRNKTTGISDYGKP